jgi:hypothetical protein
MKRFALFAVILTAVLIASCAGGPEPAAKAPDWTQSYPKPDATWTYFVGSSSEDSGDEIEATNNAALRIKDQIVSYMGVTVTVESSGNAKATLDSYAASVEVAVKSKSESRVSGFMLEDKYVYRDPKTGKVFVYLLAKYKTVDLEKEKARIQAVFKERDDATKVPEQRGDEWAEEARYYEAAGSYLEAAAAATGKDIVNAEIKYERNFNKARAILSKLSVDIVNKSPYKGQIDADWPEPLKVAVYYSDAGRKVAVPNANVIVSYPKRMASGSLDMFQMQGTTGTDGVALIELPPPNYNEEAKIDARLDFASVVSAVRKAADPGRVGAFDAILNEVVMKKATVAVKIDTPAKEFSLGVAVLDIGADGKVAGSAAQEGILDALKKGGFKAKSVKIDREALLSGDDEEILKAFAASGIDADRLVVGLVKAEEAVQDGRNFKVKVSGTIYVIEVATGDVLMSSTKSVTGIATSEASARSNAFADFGAKQAGRDIAAKME